MKYKKIIIIFIASFVILEITLRFVLFFHGQGFFREKRFISPWFTVYDQPAPLEKNGFLLFKRGQRAMINAPANTIRIFCLGGSTTVNAATKNHYPQVLQDKLNTCYRNVKFEVLNAGGDAFSSAHSLVNLALRLTYYKPDCIIVYHNINDLSVNYFGTSLRSDYSNKYMNNLYLAPECKIGFLRYFYNSRLLSFLMMKMNNNSFKNEAARRSALIDIEAGKTVFRNNLVNIVAIARAHKIKIIFGLQAACFKKTKDFPYIKESDFLAYNDIVRNVAIESGIPLVDVFSYLGQEEKYFTDLVHYTESGVNRVGDSFFNVLVKLYPDQQK